MTTTEPTTVTVRVAGELVISLDSLPQMALEQIKSALTVINEEREKQQTLKTFGWWDLPETVALYRIERRRGGDEVICLPRGFASQLGAGLAGMGIPVVWDDQRSKAAAAPGYYQMFVARDYQLWAAQAFLTAEQGIYKCPAGGGKTVETLFEMAMVQQRALLIVDKIALANQWRVRAHQFYGMPVEQDDQGHDIAPLTGDRVAGFIGQGTWEERDFTVALRQTLYERAWQLDATGWWQTWGYTKLDEVHHATADSLAEISRKVTSYYFGGVSATPAKSPAKAAIVNAIVGPIVAETPRQLLYDRGVLMRPTVEVLNGDFFTDFWPDHDAEFDKESQRWKCLVPSCKKNQKHGHRNNYSSVLKKIVEDEDRNARVAARVTAERGHVHLVPSGQLKHLKALRAALVEAGWPDDKIWMLRGEENAKGLDQQIAQQVMAADEAVILASLQVAGEGLDIPPIDRNHVSFPMRDEGATEQLAGRGERVWPGKADTVLVDYREPRMEVLEGQFESRSRVYRMQGYPVIDSAHSVAREEVAA